MTKQIHIKTAYFLFVINIITKSKKICCMGRSLKICGTIHLLSSAGGDAPLVQGLILASMCDVCTRLADTLGPACANAYC